MATQKTYDVLFPIQHDKPEPYVKGDKIKFTEEEAERFLKAGVISKPGATVDESVVDIVTTSAIDFTKLNKAQIVAEAKNQYGVELDPALTKDELLARVADVALAKSAS